MSTQLVALAAGLGLTVDTVLLVALAERRNRTARQGWMLCLAASAWCWHAGAAAYFLLEREPPAMVHAARWAAMTLMILGLLGMPCSLLHAVVRLTTTGWFGTARRPDYEPFLYAPVLLTVPIALSLSPGTASPFLDQVWPLVWPYLGVITAASTLTALVLWQSASESQLPAGPAFLRTLSMVLFVMTALLDGIMLVALYRWPEFATGWYIVLVLLPLPPALLFAYFVLRYGFLPLVLERTVVYGAIVAGLVVAHRSLVSPLEEAWRRQMGIELVWIELVVGVLLVGGYQPVRRRVREALRYLTSGTVRPFRRDVRQLAIELAAHPGHTPEALLRWFVPRLTRVPGVAAVQVLVECDGSRWERSSDVLCERLLLEQIVSSNGSDTAPAYFADQAPTHELAEALLRGRITAIVQTEYERLHNVWMIRAIGNGDGWGDEELNALVLLAEQWTGAVHLRLVQASRAAAERRAWQAEKLSAIGLLAGSLAHEIKNPLSSIKTLTTVALEESPADSEQAQSLAVVLKELDRLSQTTQQLLGVMRADGSQPEARCDLVEVIGSTLAILRHRAGQQHVALEWQPPGSPISIRSPRAAVQSLLLNLVLNAIEACANGGVVSVEAGVDHDRAVLTVRDNGPGIPAEILERLFEPLATTKPHGTGLGLYSVAQTVRDCGGEITVDSAAGKGTRFTIWLPLCGLDTA